MQWLGDSGSCLLSTLFLCLPFVDYGKAQCSLPNLNPGYGLSEDSSNKDTFPNGSSVAVQCGEGHYKTSGSETILCKNGTWTPLTLECKKKSCGSPGELINGVFDISEGTEYGATASAHCNLGFEILGIGYRQCFSFGWSNHIPVCDSVRCVDPPEVANGKITIRPSNEFVEYGDVIEYTCDKNFNLIGKPQIICNEHGQYDESPPQCKEVNCPPPNIPFSVRTEGGPPPYQLQNYVTYECKQGYVMNGTRKLVCKVDGWSSTFPTCIQVVMPFTPTVRNTMTTTGRTATTITTKQSIITNGNEEVLVPSPSPDPTNKRQNWIIGLCAASAIALVGISIYLYTYYKSKKGSKGYRGNVTAVDLEEKDQL